MGWVMKLLRLSVVLALGLGLADAAMAHEQKLEGTEWGLIGEQGDKARFISFAGSGRLFGFGGCNRISGTYEQHDGQLTISPLATTRMACESDVMTREAEFIEMLGKVRGAQADHTLLLLLDEKGSDLRTLTQRNADQAGEQ